MRVLRRQSPTSDQFTDRSGATGLRALEGDNPLSGDRPGLDDWLRDPVGPRSALVWSGGLADSLYAKDPMTWMAPGRSALAMFCDAVAPHLLDARRELVIRPHCRHAIPDPTAAASFFGERSGGPFAIALDPVALFEMDMLWRWEDHLARAFETLGPLASVVILSSPSESPDSDDLPVRAPVGEGCFDVGVLGRLVSQHCRADSLVVFPVGDEASQAALLGL